MISHHIEIQHYTMINLEQYYLDTFHVTVPEMEKLVGIIQDRGSSYADLFFENTSYRDLLLKDGEVSSGGFHVDYGVGIRALKGDMSMKTTCSWCCTGCTGRPSTSTRP